MTAYTKKYVLEKLSSAFQTPATLYKKPFINYRGKTSDTREKHTEVLAAALLENIAILEAIPSVPRNKGYKIKTHDGTTKAENSNREEERIALSMFGKEYGGIGKIIDYQVPLKNTSEDIGLGKIDLLAYDGQTLRLLELKKPKSTETLLRCVLEVYTYWHIADHGVLRASFRLSSNTAIGKAALIYPDCVAYTDYHRDSAYTKRLMALLGVELFVWDEEIIEAI